MQSVLLVWNNLKFDSRSEAQINDKIYNNIQAGPAFRTPQDCDRLLEDCDRFFGIGGMVTGKVNRSIRWEFCLIAILYTTNTTLLLNPGLRPELRH
jgi:hypothetical protein